MFLHNIINTNKTKQRNSTNIDLEYVRKRFLWDLLYNEVLKQSLYSNIIFPSKSANEANPS